MKNFLIYRSSAGSGKTYTLVKEYLKLVLKDPENVRHTLAITFTNKAADEMKSRIISSLIRLAENKDSRLLKQLKDEGVKCDIDSAARNVLNYILHNYTYFSVSTIDSFFQKVIRAFAKELKLTIGYSIELDTGVVLDKVVDDVFREIGDDEDITKYLVDFAYQNIDEDKGWHVDKNIKSLAGELFKERYWEKKLKVSPIL
ncbi:MAG TPA: UvrD-helicase domain-containing protein, partial [Ignavibacteria bacterium]|nr:UvrD-helicase domain-containing protein [Ignavibacteria bacterium]